MSRRTMTLMRTKVFRLCAWETSALSKGIVPIMMCLSHGLEKKTMLKREIQNIN